ncbi:MAG TPA: M23 family metallopeptidase [Spirochaetales bacterium]|nr:M23 family metallopeptidase [Spirochaetales bacterium]
MASSDPNRELLDSIKTATADAAALAGGKVPKRARLRSKGFRKALRVALIAAGALLVLSVLLPPFAYPVRGVATSGFFFRRAPDAISPFSVEFHPAVDLAVPRGTPVRPATWGVVAETGADDAYGNWVRVRHPLGFESFYAHLDSVSVRAGTPLVARGLASLGRSGSTGRSTGPHLHFELRFRGRPLPPGLLLLGHRIRLAILGF